MSIIERAVSKARREDQAAVEDAEGLIHQPVEHDVAHDVAGPERDAVPASQASAAAGDGAPEVDAVPAASGVELAKAGVQPLLRVEDLRCAFDVSKPFLNRLLERAPRRWLKAVDGVSFDITRGETFALVGESGCGKSTVARLIVGLYEPSAGRIVFDGHDLALVTRAAERQKLRRRFQMIFQDPYASLNPRWRVERIIAEPIRVFGLETEQAAIRARVAELLTQVGLSPADGAKYPHEFSGGQRQRICIARALALEPKIIIADESVSALDVSIKAQVINLMLDLQESMGIAFLFISHDMAVVERVSHRVAVMYLGQIVEIGPRASIFSSPQHPYTRKLMEAVPVPDPDRLGRRRNIEAEELRSPIREIGYSRPEALYSEVAAGHYILKDFAG